MQKLLVSACVTLAAVALALPLLAAPPTPDTSGMTNQPSGTSAAQQSSNLRASTVIGATVSNSQGEELGTIKNLAGCPLTGRVTYAILASGGVLGMGERLHAIPWVAFNAGCPTKAGEPTGSMAHEKHAGRPKIVLNISKDRLQNSPEFNETDWSKFGDRQFTGQLDSYYNVTSTEVQKPLTPSGQFGEDIRPEATSPSKNISALKVSQLRGVTVRNDAGTEVGRCEDVVFCANTGQIRYMALSFGKLGAGEKLYAVPCHSVAFSHQANQPEKCQIVCNVDKNELTRHQGFGETNWPRTAAETWPVRR